MAKKNGRKALLKDPLDLFMSDSTPDVEEEPVIVRRKKPKKAERPKKIRSTFHLTEDIVEEARNAVVFLSGPPERLTLASLTERALKKEIDKLKEKHNNGEDFPPRDGDLRGGRPIGS